MNRRKMGVLSIEALLLIVIVLAAFGLLFSRVLVIESHARLYAASDDACRDVAKQLYMLKRLKNAVSDNGKVLINEDNSLLGSFMGGFIDGAIDEVGESYVKAAIIKRVCQLSNVENQAQLQQMYHLKKPLDIDIDLRDNALVVELFKDFYYANMLGNHPAGIMDTHIVPLRDAKSIISGQLTRQTAEVVITNHGKNVSYVYHTTNCMGLKNANTQSSHCVNAKLLGSPINIDGQVYKLCYFCKRDTKSGN